MKYYAECMITKTEVVTFDALKTKNNHFFKPKTTNL